MREPWEIIVRPVITEKSTDQAEFAPVYTFIVDKNANKLEIRRAVETLWDVSVKDVRTMRYAGKQKRALLGRMAKSWELGRRPSFKKAVVRLADGEEIELYETG